MNRISGFLIAVCIICCFQQVKGQNNEFYDIQKLSVSKGLAHSDVNSVCQDDYGFLWIATMKGLCMFDGKTVRNVTTNTPKSNVSENHRIIAMKKGPQGKLWLLFDNNGLGIFDPKDRSLQHVHLLPEKNTENYIDLSRSYLKFLSIQDQLIYLASPRGKIYRVLLEESLPVAVEEIADNYKVNRKVGLNKIRTLFLDDKGNLLIGTRFGLYIKQASQTTIEGLSFNTQQLHGLKAIYQLHDHRYLLASNAGVFEFKLKEKKITPFHPEQPLTDVTTIYERANKEIWLGTAKTIWIQKHQSNGLIELPQPDTERIIRTSALFEDDAHSMWIGSSTVGLSYINFKDKAIQYIPLHYGEPNGAKSDIITSISAIDHYLLIGSIHSTLNFYDQSTQQFKACLISEEKISVSKVYVSKDKRIWIGTRGFGLYVSTAPFKSVESLRFEKLKHIQEDLLKKGQHGRFINDIIEDKHGNIWFTTQNYGIVCYQPQTQLLHTYPKVAESHFTIGTNLFYEPSKNLMWLGTMEHGLIRLHLQKHKIRSKKHYLHNIQNPQSLSSNHVWAVTRDTSGTIWVGTISGGINKMEDEKKGIFSVISKKDGLLDTDTGSMLFDAYKNQLWLANAGISSYDLINQDFIHYTKADGIRNEHGFKVGTAYKSKEGILYFGGVNGIAYINPQTSLSKTFIPKVQFTDLGINDKTIGIGEMVDGRVLLQKGLYETSSFQLLASEKDFNISFTAIYPSGIEQIEYMYQLEGYHDHWLKVGKGENKVYYSNLPSGQYTFKVKARVSNGEWSPEKTLQIEIERPFWQQWYFVMSVSLIIGLLVFAINWYYIKQQKLIYKLDMVRLSAEKDQEVIDEKLKFFTNVSHELRTPLTLMQGPLEELVKNRSIEAQAKENILLAFSQTNKLLQLVNQLMDFRKMENQAIELHLANGNFYEFLYETYTTFRLKAKAKQIDYQIITDERALEMAYDQDKMGIVFNNLLSNAFKFTKEGGQIIIHLKSTEKEGEPFVEVQVEDNGLGIEKEGLEKIFDRFYQAGNANSIQLVGTGLGLSIAKGIVEAHQGSLSVESEKEKGTVFTLLLPIHQIENKAEPLPQTYYIAEEITENTTAEKEMTFPDMRILLVEDNQEIRGFLKTLLQETCQLLEATNGKEALEILQEEKEIHLVISDIMMPKMDGLELCTKIKQDPKLWHIPVFLLTARSSHTHELEGLESRADAYITKPFRPTILKQQIYNTLHHRHTLLSMYHNVMKLQQPIQLYSQEVEDQFLEKSIRIIEEHIDDPNFSVQVLVNEIAMSQSALYKKMKEITGKSLVEFIKDVRMRKAGELLLSTKMKVFEVAYAVGFNDVKYFRKCFKEHYGISSTEYIKQLKSVLEEDLNI